MKLPSPFRSVATAGRKIQALSLLAFLTRLILLCVLPLVLLATYLAVNHVQTMQSERDDEADHQVRNVATAIDRQIGSQIAALQMLAASPLLDDPSRLNEFYNEARAFRESFGGHIVLADLSMQMLFNTRVPFGEPLPKLPRPRGHAAAPAVLKTGKPSVGDMFFGPIAKEPLVAVVVPVIRDGQTRLLLLSIIETRQFQQRLDEVSLPAGWSVTVLDGKDEVMARRAPLEIKNHPRDEEPAQLFVAKSGVSHWSVVLQVPGSVYRAPIIAAAAALMIAILAATLVSIVGGRLASLRLARSVASLVETPSQQSTRQVISEIEAVRQTLIGAAGARNAAESAQRESERRYQDLWEKAPVMMISVDAKARIEYASDRFCEELGYGRHEVVGQTPFVFQTKQSAHYAESEVFPTFLKIGSVKDVPLQFSGRVER